MQAQQSIDWIKTMNSKDRPSMANTARRAVGRGGNYGSLFGVQ